MTVDTAARSKTNLDWDDAYTNGAYIAGAAEYPARWQAAADDFRRRMAVAGRSRLDVAYGEGPRHVLDLFFPVGAPQGLVVFVHGGYWLRFDKSSWSHLAEGAIAAGWAVAMPSYPLAPDAKVPEISAAVARAIAFAAAQVPGPMRLAGHSAGGHLVSRMACLDGPLPSVLQKRIAKVVSISGLHDLRPLLKTKMAEQLFKTQADAEGESPALLKPMDGLDITCWVGANERPEFLRQSQLLSNIWFGLEEY
jgi:arylformamidase